ncbi:tyrosine-type recombinase/integrase [Bacillus sporothermodurans]|uniref:tyrosine-type recombinase/integrase n=1 Tax=Heyndrickxia sporothermodurans TaxID=46224 RepID=UPI00192ABAC1|nr:tyrosine-type recombinase/integrase [Heyndrickxia sporothermodurans]MBL5833283.1 tyrosine-type recombinase/integrase [Heyndrickxia sporothermodurans]MBL5872379.1 tyrosine-type recombinase/integrase [Heyndrickxia sporothermodurans]
MLIRFAMKEFLSEKEFENLSQNTLKGYNMLFEDFLEWCDEQGYERIEKVTSRALKSYLNVCKTEKGNNPTSINTKRKQFRAFFNFLVSEGMVDDNPTDSIKRVREDIRIKTFTDEEVKQVLSYLRRTKRKEDSFYAVRNYVIFLTLIGTGLRASELCSLKWNNVDIQRRAIKVFGKMRREESVPLSERLCDELRYWQTYCINNFGSQPQSVFVNARGQELTVNGLKCWFKRLASKMEFPETRCSAHSCRHYFAKTWIQNGGDISTLAKVLRHSSIKTTEKYLQFWGNEVADDNDKFNPLNRLNF